MSDQSDRTSAEIIADTVLQKDKSVRQLYAAIPRWPLNISLIFAILFAVSIWPTPWLPLGKYTQSLLFVGFAGFLSKYLSNLHQKFDQITTWISDQPAD